MKLKFEFDLIMDIKDMPNGPGLPIFGVASVALVASLISPGFPSSSDAIFSTLLYFDFLEMKLIFSERLRGVAKKEVIYNKLFLIIHIICVIENPEELFLFLP